MSEIEKILKFLEHRAGSLHDWAFTYDCSADLSADGPECKARAAILRAQSRIVKDLVKEIKDAMIFEAETSMASARCEDRRRVVLSEMSGPMDAVFLADSSNEAVHGYALRDHEALLYFGYGHFQLCGASLPPLAAPACCAQLPYLDMRYALVTYQGGGFEASIYNSRPEAEAAMEEWAEENNAGVVDYNNSIALCSVSPILIPRRGSGVLR